MLWRDGRFLLSNTVATIRLIQDTQLCFIAFVGEGHIIKCDVALNIVGFKLQSIWLVLNLNWQVQIFKDAVKEGQGTLNLDLDIEQLSNGEEQAALQGGESDDTSQGQACVRVLDNLPASNKIHNGGCDRKE